MSLMPVCKDLRKKYRGMPHNPASTRTRLRLRVRDAKIAIFGRNLQMSDCKPGEPVTHSLCGQKDLVGKQDVENIHKL